MSPKYVISIVIISKVIISIVVVSKQAGVFVPDKFFCLGSYVKKLFTFVK